MCCRGSSTWEGPALHCLCLELVFLFISIWGGQGSVTSVFFITILCPRYFETVSDVLNSVKKMEESLKRLKQARRAPATSPVSSSGGMSDDDKIRLQLALDVQFLGEQVPAAEAWL